MFVQRKLNSFGCFSHYYTSNSSVWTTGKQQDMEGASKIPQWHSVRPFTFATCLGTPSNKWNGSMYGNKLLRMKQPNSRLEAIHSFESEVFPFFHKPTQHFIVTLGKSQGDSKDWYGCSQLSESPLKRTNLDLMDVEKTLK